MKLICTTGADHRRHNIPDGNKVAIIIVDKHGLASVHDIILAHRNSANNSDYYTIYSNNAVYIPLYYTLLFPYSEHEWY